MQRKKQHLQVRILSAFLFFLFFVIHYTGILPLRIGGVSPLIILPLLTAFSMFESLPAAAFAGLLVGMGMDSITSGALCFNAIVLLLTAVLVFLLSNNLFNKNIRSAAVLTLFASLSYFMLRWLFFYAFTADLRDHLAYLLYFAFPTVVYTEIFIFPFYFLYRSCYTLKGG